MEGVSYELDRPLHKHCSTLKLTSPYARTSGNNEHDRIPVINYREARTGLHTRRQRQEAFREDMIILINDTVMTPKNRSASKSKR